MATLCNNSATAFLCPDYTSAPTLDVTVSKLLGFATFLQLRHGDINLRRDFVAWIEGEKREYRLSLASELNGFMAPNLAKAGKDDPDYCGELGPAGEFLVEGWRRKRYIWLKIRPNLTTS